MTIGPALPATIRLTALGALSRRLGVFRDARFPFVKRVVGVDAIKILRAGLAAATVDGAHNKPFVRFVAPVLKGKSVAGAKVELDVQGKTGVQRKVVAVESGDDLEQAAGRELYRDFRIGEVRTAKNDTWMELRYPGEAD